ncbi:hypothetical protein DO72_2435 [Burkholderia pseudomallei]|nr:hypothetical protein DO72_2435 [Burkholderia pseudomallei]KGV23289.1 hypothetical protein X891_5992 [Burkholderia pseudomallei TSV 43]KGW19256.1 hypothetical protein X882_5320 [Burkholderia pseudomallei MSHR4303]
MPNHFGAGPSNIEYAMQKSQPPPVCGGPECIVGDAMQCPIKPELMLSLKTDNEAELATIRARISAWRTYPVVAIAPPCR